MTGNVDTKNAWPRVARALSLLALGAAVAVGVGFPVAGALTGGTLRANIAFALIVISVLVALAVLLSYGASLRVQQIARAVWLAIAIVCLAFTQYILSLNDPEAHKAADTVLLAVMFGLTFPAGSIAIGFTFVYSSFVLADRGVASWDLLILWAVFVAAGYLQWFKLVPYLVTKLRARKKTSHA